jgi:hypothetical protein
MAMGKLINKKCVMVRASWRMGDASGGKSWRLFHVPIPKNTPMVWSQIPGSIL